MKQKIVKDLIKILFLFGGIFAFFYVGLQLLSEDKKNSWLYSGDEAKLISYEQEIKLGNLIDEYLIDTDETILLQNELIDSVVWAVRSRLEKQIIMSEYDYKIVVVDDDLVNAFTIPGGRIYIYKGLFEFCESAEQLAAVLAHEIGHVEKRHTVSKLIKEFGLKILFSIVTGGDTILLGELWESTVSGAFDRSNEKEADQYAMELLERAKIAPTAIASFFRKLNREELDYNENMEFLMTHPHKNSRIKASLSYETAGNFEAQDFEIDWKWIKEALK